MVAQHDVVVKNRSGNANVSMKGGVVPRHEYSSYMFKCCIPKTTIRVSTRTKISASPKYSPLIRKYYEDSDGEAGILGRHSYATSSGIHGYWPLRNTGTLALLYNPIPGD